MEFGKLAQTLDCGQCFRWELQPDGSWKGGTGGKFLHITVENFPQVLRDGCWAEYFDMGTDYEKIRRDLCENDEMLRKAAEFAPEIRILRQDPWEALCSFIISQCNNIKRIKGIVARLCGAYGEPEGAGWHAFPKPEALACRSKEDLLRLGCGYRAGYLIDASRRVAAGSLDLSALRELPLGEAREKLMEIEGVGPKVADCALLYGLHRLDAFPVDVWMKRAMDRLFPGRAPADFGPYAGIAQQYIFHYSRNHSDLFAC